VMPATMDTDINRAASLLDAAIENFNLNVNAVQV
jgi:hypothetical protein